MMESKILRRRSMCKSIKWIMCLSPMLLRLIFDKKATNFTHFVAIRLLQAIQNSKYFCIFVPMESIAIQQVWWQSDRNYDFYRIFKILEESISATMGSLQYIFKSHLTFYQTYLFTKCGFNRIKTCHEIFKIQEESIFASMGFTQLIYELDLPVHRIQW